MLFPTSDKARAVRSCGGGAGKKEKVRLQRGQRKVLEKEALFFFFCKSAPWKCVAFVCPGSLWWIAPSLLLNASDGVSKTKHRVTSICPPHPYSTSLPELLFCLHLILVIDGWNKMWQGPRGLRVLDLPLTPVIRLTPPGEGLAQCEVFTDVCGMKEWMKEVAGSVLGLPLRVPHFGFLLPGNIWGHWTLPGPFCHANFWATK